MKLSSIIAIAVFFVTVFSILVYDHSNEVSEVSSNTHFEKSSVLGVNRFFAFNGPKAVIHANLDNGATSMDAVGSDLSASQKLTESKRPSFVIHPSTIAAANNQSVPMKDTIPKLERNQSCLETLDLKCDMHPYVKFWNRRLYEEDCYKSPLMHPLGLLGPVEEQKYVVFQPDGGGWNNIRMAAEAAMIFAHVTGRYFFLRI